MTRTITAYFDGFEQAERAATDLATRVGGVRGTVYSARTGDDLSAERFPDEDASLYREGIRRGGAVLTASVPDDKADAVADALEAGGSIDIDERAAAWRREGWTGTAAPTGSATATTATGAATAARGVGESGEERIPIVEERVVVGKRDTGLGRVRVRSYVVETPVQEQVTLREERVDIERRPVDRPVAAGDDAFRERTVEAAARREEAVVSKEARVTEEVVVRKTADERTETVRDTVRRTEVEVEDERGRTGKGKTERRRDRT